MSYGFYAAAAGMDAQQARVDTLTNNLANTDTPGFTENQVTLTSFPDMLSMLRVDGNNSGSLGSGAFGPLLQNTTTDFTPAPLKRTGVATDLGLSGNGFFTLRASNGQTMYTRDGSFTVNAGGYLTTSTGELVLGKSGPIQVGGAGFSVNEYGGVTVGNKSYSLRLTSFSNTAALQMTGNNLYTATAAAGAKVSANTQVRQGYLEGSNADLIKGMVDIMAAERAYQSDEKAISAEDTLTKAGVQLGSPT